MNEYDETTVGRRNESGEFVPDPDMIAEAEPNVEVQYDSSPLYLFLGRAYVTTGVPVVELLGEIHQHIERKVLPRFEKFF